MPEVTREDAENALACVRQQFQNYLFEDESGPQLIENWHWLESGPTRWAIVWEEGPFEWSFICPEGGLDEELSAEAGRPMKTKAAENWPEHIFAEAVTSWAVGLYLI